MISQWFCPCLLGTVWPVSRGSSGRGRMGNSEQTFWFLGSRWYSSIHDFSRKLEIYLLWLQLVKSGLSACVNLVTQPLLSWGAFLQDTLPYLLSYRFPAVWYFPQGNRDRLSPLNALPAGGIIKLSVLLCGLCPTVTSFLVFIQQTAFSSYLLSRIL